MGKRYNRSLKKLRIKFGQWYVPLWLKGVLATFFIFFLPFVYLSYTSISENVRDEKESLYQNFYLRAQAFSLEIRAFLKDRVDLQSDNRNLVMRATFGNSYDIPVPDAVRLNIQAWLAESQGPAALVEFYIEPEKNRPWLIYLEKKYGRRFFIFEAAFLSQLLDVSHNIGADDRIFMYNVHESPFLSNTIEAEYQVPADWQSAIHKLFWQRDVNGIQEINLQDQSFIIARYRLKELPLVIYLARPYQIAMSTVEATGRRLLIIYTVVGLIVFLLMMFVFRDQVRTLRHLQAFIAGTIAPIRAKRVFLTRDERSDVLGEIINIRETEKRARSDRDRAEMRTKAKGDFLASMSHEIRNPLNAILGISDLLRERASDAETKSYLQMIRDSGDSLLQIINDILDISKIENDRLSLESIPFDLQKLISDIQFFYRAKAEERHNVITTSFNGQVGALVLGDPTRVRQIVTNLVSNALKFTEKGSLHVRLHRQKDSEFVHIFVHDTGIGISPENISRLFEAYEQAESSTTRKYGGTGLGLNITLKLTTLMGGTVRCRSRVGRGTTFCCTLRLPVSVASVSTEKVVQVTNAVDLSKLRILVAEDNEINQILMTENLSAVVAEVVIAENGSEAVERAAKGKWDLIFMDMIMPELDGLEATRTIRQFEKTHNLPRVPIVALSGNAMTEDVAAAHEAGCDAHLAKPVRKEQLIATLMQFCLAKIHAGSGI